ncbi:hypothetical protein BCF59_0179 [Mycoplasmopsis mustelae]|uniref:Lipoprotein n=1 Tax=Mycoplasmopsis mustelae TaxID=171289 RepID=A0A4R7UCS0_9BACT|nr:hypothetical protein [Mycoplasmopsis mustelae]TDV24227.1 hypothetical protein BCF59_0179 [Mycoplasmopsis mustelae]
MQIKKWIKFLMLSSSVMTPLVVAVSCGRNVDTTEKIAQDEKFADKKVKDVAESIWLEGTVKKLYAITPTQDLLANVNFENDAFQAYSTYADFKNQTDSSYMWKETTKLLQSGLLNQADRQALQSLSLYKSKPNKDQFKILFKIDASGVKLNVLKMLLVDKYLTLSNQEEIKKVDDKAYETNKNNYDTNNFFLIDYLVNKKIVQLWQYSNPGVDIFTIETSQIQNIADYNKIATESYTDSDTVSNDLLFFNNPYEGKLNDYVGIKDANSFNLNNNLQNLKTIVNASELSGFYDPINRKLVKVLDNEELAQPIAISGDLNKIQISYLNRILPLAKDIMIDNPKKGETNQPDKIKQTILSMDETPFKNSLIKLIVLLIQNDESLYNKALNAFVALGNKLTVDNDIIKKAVEGEKFIG